MEVVAMGFVGFRAEGGGKVAAGAGVDELQERLFGKWQGFG
jgi:hypothetical protein